MASLLQYPPKQSEFEVQAELYFALKRCGYDVRGEVKARHPEGGFCRMDIVLYTNQKPRLIVECKNHSRSKKWHRVATRFNRDSRQCRRYKSYGVPVFQCLSVGHVPYVIEAVIEELSK